MKMYLGDDKSYLVEMPLWKVMAYTVVLAVTILVLAFFPFLLWRE